MVRVLLFVILVFVVAAGFAWLADRPGGIVLTWQGYEIRTSLMVAAIVAALAIAAVALVGAIVRAIVTGPRTVGHFLGARRRDRGWRALSRGMIAVGAGDTRAARKSAEESRTLLGNEPLALLLSAQAAQLAGDPLGARSAFEALSARQDTRLLGLHGLFVEAQRQGEREAARHFAEEAAKAAPHIAWAGMALFEFESQAGDWQAALRTLSANADAKLVDKARARRLRAVLLTARAMQLEAGDPAEARALALEAHRLAPDLVPAAVVAGRLLARAGEVKRAAKVLEAGWRASPHPEIAEAYASVRPGDSVRDRLKRMRRLSDIRPNNAEGSIAIARAAIDARQWQTAREALEGLVRGGATERVCMLMAEIEEGENGDQGRVRFWLTRAFNAPRDPVWVADGRVFDRWAPVSPVSGRIDAFEWKVVATALPAPAALDASAEGSAAPRQSAVPLPQGAADVADPLPPERSAGQDSPPLAATSTAGEIPASAATPAALPHAAAPASGLATLPDSAPPPPDAKASASPAAGPGGPAQPGSSMASASPSPPSRPPPAPLSSQESPGPRRPAPAARPASSPAPAGEPAPRLPRAPDDPGPDPLDDEASPTRRGFRLF